MTLYLLALGGLFLYLLGDFVGHWSREDEVQALRASRDHWRSTAVWAIDSLETTDPPPARSGDDAGKEI